MIRIYISMCLLLFKIITNKCSIREFFNESFVCLKYIRIIINRCKILYISLFDHNLKSNYLHHPSWAHFHIFHIWKRQKLTALLWVLGILNIFTQLAVKNDRNGGIWQKVVFHWRSSSIEGRLPSKVVILLRAALELHPSYPELNQEI